MSSAAEGAGAPGLLDGVLARGGAREAVSDRALLQAMLDVEAGLARAAARAGLIPGEHAEAIARACRADAVDAAAIARAASETGTPVVALVAELERAVGGPAAADVHRGATSQDVVDTATMLVARRALGAILADLGGAAGAAAELAARHRDTIQVGRTLLQPAVPITFGLAAAGWLRGLDEAIERLSDVRERRLAVQLGGAAGTLAALGEAGPAVVEHLAAELGLTAPLLPWHAERSRVADLAGALGLAAGAIAKPAGDMLLLSQAEVGEVREGGAGRGGSSAMPHKRNPVALVGAGASAARAPGLVAALFAAMAHEHQRAAGAWHAEWRPLADLHVAVGSAAAWLRDALERLEVDPGRMRANLDATGGVVMAERIAGALSPALGRAAARRAVGEACAEASERGRPLAEALGARAEVAAHLSPAAIATLLDPAGYLGSAGAFVDRALAAHQAAARTTSRARGEED